MESVDSKFFPIPTDARDFFIKFHNEINEFYLGIFKIETWSKIIENKNTDDKALILSYLNPLAHSLLSYPYIFKNRVAYCLTSLIHDLSKTLIDDFNEDLKERKINLSTLTGDENDRFKGRYVKLAKKLGLNFSPVNSSLNEINRANLKEFRHSWNHRFPQNLEIGYSKNVTRLQKNGKVAYGFGGGNPLKFLESDNKTDENLIEILKNEHEDILLAFDKYWEFNLKIFDLIK